MVIEWLYSTDPDTSVRNSTIPSLLSPSFYLYVTFHTTIFLILPTLFISSCSLVLLRALSWLTWRKLNWGDACLSTGIPLHYITASYALFSFDLDFCCSHFTERFIQVCTIHVTRHENPSSFPPLTVNGKDACCYSGKSDYP